MIFGSEMVTIKVYKSAVSTIKQIQIALLYLFDEQILQMLTFFIDTCVFEVIFIERTQ